MENEIIFQERIEQNSTFKKQKIGNNYYIMDYFLEEILTTYDATKWLTCSRNNFYGMCCRHNIHIF